MSGACGSSDSSGVVRLGHLRKLKSMKRKFFVLRGETALGPARLEYYESEKKFRAGAAPRKSVPLKTCFNITRRLDLKHRLVIALYTKEECFCVVPEGEDELHAWLADLIKLHRDDTSEELLHPTQHIWQVNVQKKGLGASKNIIGLYNLCLTDKTLILVKIKTANNNIIYETTMPDRVEFSLKNIRRCGDSECFFYMEVGRLTSTGAGELWMHTDDANIAQSMHSTIYHAMSNCAKDETPLPPHRNRSASATEDPRTGSLPPRRQTYSEKGRGTSTDRGLCMSSCIRQCVCATGTNSIDCSGAAIAPMSPKVAANENQLPNSTLSNEKPKFKHHRTVSLPTGCAQFQVQEPLKICHERTRSAPLTGDEVDHATIDKVARHSSCKAVNGIDFGKKQSWPRRASIGARLTKLSPAHTKNTSSTRNRCDSMPSRVCPKDLEPDGTPTRHSTEITEDSEQSRDEPDAAEWHRTPRIPEEPDAAYCEMTPGENDTLSTNTEVSTAVEEAIAPNDYLPMGPNVGRADSGYVDVQRTLSPAASSGSVCSGTPSTDPRFSEYQLEPAVAHILPDEDERPPRAYSVGSRPTTSRPAAEAARMRAYSVGARTRHPHHHPTSHHHTTGKTSSSAPLLPGGSADDLMVLDFSNNSPKTKPVIARTPPSSSFVSPPARIVTPRYSKPSAAVKVDEYVDMSPTTTRLPTRTHPEVVTPLVPTAPVVPFTVASSPPGKVATTPEGYVEMNYCARRNQRDRTPSRPISIAPDRDRIALESAPSTSEEPRRSPVLSPPPLVSPSTPSEGGTRPGRLGSRDGITPLGSQTIFPLSLESPATPPRSITEERQELESIDIFDEELPHHALSTVCEAIDEGASRSPEIGSPPHYVTLATGRIASRPIAAPPKPAETEDGELSCNPTATKTMARAGEGCGGAGGATLVRAVAAAAPARFSLGEESARKSTSPAPLADETQLNYAALDLEPRATSAAASPRTYTQIDFVRSEKMHTADAN